MFRYTYAEIRIINIQIEKEDRHMSRLMRITRAPCQRYVSNSQEKKNEHKPCSARNTGRKTGREEIIHTRHRLIETGKQTRNVRDN